MKEMKWVLSSKPSVFQEGEYNIMVKFGELIGTTENLTI